MSERNYYVICDDNCKFEGMTKEQIYDAIAEATGHTPTPVDEAFITKIKEQNGNLNAKLWIGTNAEYIALTEKEQDTVYLILDAVSEYDTLQNEINDIREEYVPVPVVIETELGDGDIGIDFESTVTITEIPVRDEQNNKLWQMTFDGKIKARGGFDAVFTFLEPKYQDASGTLCVYGDTESFGEETIAYANVDGYIELCDKDGHTVIIDGDVYHTIYLHGTLYRSRN